MPGTKLNAPVKNFRLPTFNKAGLRTSLLTGSQAIYVSSTQIDVTDMRFLQYNDNGSGLVDTQLLSPSATVMTKDNLIIVSGNDRVRLIREGLDATGEQWTYTHADTDKKISLRKNVRVIFQAEMGDLIK